MARRLAFRTPAASVLAVLAIGLAGCSFGEKEVSEAEIEEQVATQLAAQVTTQPKPDIDCPGPLKAEVGATLDCVLSVQGEPDRYPVKVEVKSVEDDKATFDIEVGNEPIK